jgi:hypothetical protein
VAAVVVTGMIACLVIAGVALGEQASPNWNGSYLVIACMLVSIEGFVTYHLYRARHLYISGGTKYRAIELFLLLLLFEIATDLVNGQPVMANGVPHIDVTGLLLFIPVFLAWRVATNTAADVATVRREVATVAPSQLLASSDEIRSTLEMVRPAVQNMLARFFAGGVAIFLIAGISQTQQASALHLQHPNAAGPLLNVLLYFALGMGMMVLLRYGTLRVEWSAGRRVVADDLSTRYLRYGLIFLAGLAVFASLLPTSYGTELLGSLQGSLHGVLSSLGTWFANLMRGFQPSQQEIHHVLPTHPGRTAPPRTSGVPHGPSRPHHTNLALARLIQAIIFWLAVAALAVYLARQVWRERAGHSMLDPSRLTRFIGWLEGMWQAMRRRVRRVVALARPRERSEASAAESPIVSSRRSRLRLASMSPRERIVYYLVSIAQRLERQGRRAPSQTALELEARVGPTLGDAAPDMYALTQAYLEARYSMHPVGEPEEQKARHSWSRLKHVLRR